MRKSVLKSRRIPAAQDGAWDSGRTFAIRAAAPEKTKWSETAQQPTYAVANMSQRHEAQQSIGLPFWTVLLCSGSIF